MTSIPAIIRSAQHQLTPDREMLWVTCVRASPFMEAPNLLLVTGQRCTLACPHDCEAHTGLYLPMLSLR